MMTASTLSGTESIFAIPGIGRRTAALLYESGVRTVNQFVALPDLLLREAFGPSLATVRQRTESLLTIPTFNGRTVLQGLFRLFSD